MNPSAAVFLSEAERLARPLQVSVEETQTCYLAGNGLHGGAALLQVKLLPPTEPREREERERGGREME